MTDDERAIRDVIARQFGSLNWRPGTSGDWDAFTADFLPDAPLYAAARPRGLDNQSRCQRHQIVMRANFVLGRHPFLGGSGSVVTSYENVIAKPLRCRNGGTRIG